MPPPHDIDTRNPREVAELARRVFEATGSIDSRLPLDRIFGDVIGMFEGRYEGYLAIDMRYHDLEHTLQATVCMLKLLEGHHRTGDVPRLGGRDRHLALLAVLLHDTGYLKRSDDTSGTGAKYTFVHVKRSCEFARDYLPGIGFTPGEIDDVTSVIGCTGPLNWISAVNFSRPAARLLACMLVTADYLGQMGAPDYVDKLPALYEEFREAYEFEGTPDSKRVFKSAGELIAKTPAFWSGHVQPLLYREAEAVARYLEDSNGRNPYFTSVEANIERVRNIIAGEQAIP